MQQIPNLEELNLKSQVKLFVFLKHLSLLLLRAITSLMGMYLSLTFLLYLIFDLQILSTMPHLKTIIIGQQTTQSLLADLIAHCPNLETLYVGYCLQKILITFEQRIFAPGQKLP